MTNEEYINELAYKMYMDEYSYFVPNFSKTQFTLNTNVSKKYVDHVKKLVRKEKISKLFKEDNK